MRSSRSPHWRRDSNETVSGKPGAVHRVGWTVGGGFEWMFLPNWSAKVEYFYYDLGSVTYALSPLVTSVINVGPPIDRPAMGVFPRAATRFSGHSVRAGVNYHFNWGAS